MLELYSNAELCEGCRADTRNPQYSSAYWQGDRRRHYAGCIDRYFGTGVYTVPCTAWEMFPDRFTSEKVRE